MSELWIRCPTAGALLADDSYPWASSHASRAEHKHLGKVQFLLYLCSRKNQKRRLLESCSTERTVFAVLIFFGESCTQNLFLLLLLPADSVTTSCWPRAEGDNAVTFHYIIITALHEHGENPLHPPNPTPFSQMLWQCILYMRARS